MLKLTWLFTQNILLLTYPFVVTLSSSVAFLLNFHDIGLPPFSKLLFCKNLTLFMKPPVKRLIYYVLQTMASITKPRAITRLSK